MVITELPAVIVTLRLLLRQFNSEDAPGVLAFAGDPEAIRHLIWRGVTNLDEARNVIDFYYRPKGVYALVLRETGMCIGSFALNLDAENEKATFGYVLNRDYWNKGYMTEALRAVISMCFEQLAINRVESSHFIGNEASGRVMEKCGMRKEGLCLQEFKVKGAFRDAVHYGITRGQYLRLLSGETANDG